MNLSVDAHAGAGGNNFYKKIYYKIYTKCIIVYF